MKTHAPSLDFDVERARRSIVSLQAAIPADAFTAPILGERRGGSGVVIGEGGLVLTIGYLITEADEIWLTQHAVCLGAVCLAGRVRKTQHPVVTGIRNP